MGDQQLNILLDTHVWIWAFEGSERLGKKSREILSNPQTKRWISPVSTLEIARLIEGGDIVITCTMEEWVKQSIKDLQLKTLEVSHEIAMRSYQLGEAFHRDPADRQIVATALTHGLILMTADERILLYAPVITRDARE